MSHAQPTPLPAEIHEPETTRPSAKFHKIQIFCRQRSLALANSSTVCQFNIWTKKTTEKVRKMA